MANATLESNQDRNFAEEGKKHLNSASEYAGEKERKLNLLIPLNAYRKTSDPKYVT
jgi:hypothetical protein